MSGRITFIQRQIANHVKLFFSAEASAILDSSSVRYVNLDEALRLRESVIAIPVDIPLPEKPGAPWQVACNGTQLTLWNRLQKPVGKDWESLPGDETPLWHKHSSGTVIPAWNLFGNLSDLLTFGEEQRTVSRDQHGRFAAAHSPRKEAGLLEIPAFNEAVAALIAACAGIKRSGSPEFELGDLCGPLVAVLSHDCDILLGNDMWTQMVRGLRVLSPLLRGRPPHLQNLWWMLRNAATPRRFYFDNVTGMIDLERTFDFTSTFYLINGKGGRFGARSGSPILKEVVEVTPHGWDIGMHYNYDTFLQPERFQKQHDELLEIVGHSLRAGRAHYLRFDSKRSFEFISSYGIRVDESAGFADCIGYRTGAAGCIQGYDSANDRALEIFEVPLVIMEHTLLNQYGDDSVAVFRRIVRHLACVGGALSVLFHPGQFHNPEFPHMLGLYHRLLIELRDVSAVSRTALSLVDEITD